MVCGYGHYQPDAGQFSCVACPLGQTTRTENSASRQVNSIHLMSRHTRVTGQQNALTVVTLPTCQNTQHTRDTCQ